jgi:hypothetical protein
MTDNNCGEQERNPAMNTPPGSESQPAAVGDAVLPDDEATLIDRYWRAATIFRSVRSTCSTTRS